ncbi:MAG: hypothetical protein OXC07_03565 [Kistimonas sp.]|nr:hypothetical protein [Kistimonas sp.]
MHRLCLLLESSPDFSDKEVGGVDGWEANPCRGCNESGPFQLMLNQVQAALDLPECDKELASCVDARRVVNEALLQSRKDFRESVRLFCPVEAVRQHWSIMVYQRSQKLLHKRITELDGRSKTLVQMLGLSRDLRMIRLAADRRAVGLNSAASAVWRKRAHPRLPVPCRRFCRADLRRPGSEGAVVGRGGMTL